MTSPSKPAPKPEIQMALLKVMKALTTLPAQVVFYGSIILSIAATGGAHLPGVLGMLSTTIGMNLLSNMLERVVRGENVPDEEIRKVVQETIQTTAVENLLTSNEFQRVTARVFRQFDLLKYAVQKGEINIAALLSEQFAEHKIMLEEMQVELTAISEKLDTLATREQGERIINLIRELNEPQGISVSLRNADNMINEIARILSDETKDGPRLFTVAPVEQNKFNPRKWVSEKFRLILWCEHSHLPLPVLNGIGDTRGVYEFDLPYEWFVSITPYLKQLTSALSILLPISYSATKLAKNDAVYKSIEGQLDLCKSLIDATINDIRVSINHNNVADWAEETGGIDFHQGRSFIHANKPVLRQLHAFLKEKDPSFGGLVRVMNKRNEFLWVHERFASEY